MKTAVTEMLGIQYPIIQGGMVIGLINDLPTCKDLIERIVRECRASLAAARAMAA